MAVLTFKTEKCKGCGLCVDACPKGVLALAKDKINQKGHHPVEAVNMDACIGCYYLVSLDCFLLFQYFSLL